MRLPTPGRGSGSTCRGGERGPQCRTRAGVDRGPQDFTDMVFAETAYADSDGGTARLSNHRKQVASDGRGTIVIHNDANRNPNTDRDWNQRDWQTLNPQR